jgi:DNA replication protein DnaC
MLTPGRDSEGQQTPEEAPRSLSGRPVEDWGKLLGDTAAVTAMLDRLLHHAQVLTCGPRSWRTRLHSDRTAS